jgi:alpha-L-glutamate ligase-like protein
MAVSKLALGMNARNYLYIRPNNKRRSKARADNKLLTKQRLRKHKVPTPNIIKVFRSLPDVRDFDWTTVEGDFVLKPARGFGGGGIVVVRKWNGTTGRLVGGKEANVHMLEAEIFSILDGAYSLNNLPDKAFLEERVQVASSMRKLSPKGVPDIRIIVKNRVPIMAMLRLPTEHSVGRANLHQGALGVGIDLRTGITTKAVFYGEAEEFIPGTRTKVRGIKIPQWDRLLKYAVRAQDVSGLGFAGIDMVLDEEKGPLVLEVNARPGLQIQLANGASLRTRLERIDGMNVPSVEFGIDLAKRLFAEHALSEVKGETNVLRVIERVMIVGPKKKKTVQAKVDTGAFRTAVDRALVDDLELEQDDEMVEIRTSRGLEPRKTVRLTLRLRGSNIDTKATYTDRSDLKFPVIIGRRDLKGFLVDPSAYPEDIT